MGELAPVLETLVYLKKFTSVWFEITNLMIPGLNDSEKEIEEMTQWIAANLGPSVPLHFTAFHPDYKILDRPPTPAATLAMARNIAIKNGLRYVYTGNVHDKTGSSTYCHSCGQILIGRDWYVLSDWNLTSQGCCNKCHTPLPGVFNGLPGDWGSKRLPVNLKNFQQLLV